LSPLIKSQLIKYKAGWKKSFENWFAQDENGNPLPWMTYTFIEYISKKLNKDHEIFEFGLGASTFYFAPRVKKVVVLETNPMWLRIMKERLKEANITNVEIILMEDGFNNKDYENFASKYSKDTGKKFDYIFVDSMKRHQCLKKSTYALKKNGSLILDDSERRSYKGIFKNICDKGFKKEDFFGISPGQCYLKNTTVFTKLNNN